MSTCVVSLLCGESSLNVNYFVNIQPLKGFSNIVDSHSIYFILLFNYSEIIYYLNMRNFIVNLFTMFINIT